MTPEFYSTGNPAEVALYKALSIEPVRQTSGFAVYDWEQMNRGRVAKADEGWVRKARPTYETRDGVQAAILYTSGVPLLEVRQDHGEVFVFANDGEKSRRVAQEHPVPDNPRQRASWSGGWLPCAPNGSKRHKLMSWAALQGSEREE